eukprot:360170-Chlamydomonas_euryale.AAC.1
MGQVRMLRSTTVDTNLVVQRQLLARRRHVLAALCAHTHHAEAGAANLLGQLVDCYIGRRDHEHLEGGACVGGKGRGVCDR